VFIGLALRRLFNVSTGGRTSGYAAALLLVGALIAVSSSSEAASSRTGGHRELSRAPRFVAHRSVTPPAGSTVLTLPQTNWPRAVPPGFLGVGVEYKTLFRYAGRDPHAVDPVFEQLVRNLSPGQPAQVRIGGDTTDWSWWPVPGMVTPPGIFQVLTPRWAAVARSFAEGVDARLIMGINLKADSVKVAVTEAHQLLTRMPTGSIEAFELGNEPELFSSFGSGSGPYTFDTFLQAWTQISQALPTQVPLAGPAFTFSAWAPYFARFLGAEPLVRIATGHRYPLNNCTDPNAPAFPSVAHLLGARASDGLAQDTEGWIKDAHADHHPIRIDEINTTPCPGAALVLRTFAESLWALRILLDLADVGADGVNIMTTAASSDDLFTPSETRAGWQAAVQPEYYGLLMFAQAVPPGSRLTRLTQSTTSPIQAWATRASDGTVRVVVINVDSREQTVAVNTTAASGPATLERLEGSSPTTRYGVKLGGQTFGSETTTGRLAGRQRTSKVTSRRGQYIVRMRPVSAALLTIP
jgi:hypothetical protein